MKHLPRRRFVYPRAEARPREGQYLRRRHRARSPARLHRREALNDVSARFTSHEVFLRFSDDVHRRWPRDRDDRGARLMAAYERVLVEVKGHVGTVTLNRPEKLNAFDPEACDDLVEALRMLSTADAVRVIVITGAGRAFCAGADLGVLGSRGEELVRAGKDIALTIRNAPKPVLAAVNGPAARRGATPAPGCGHPPPSGPASSRPG